MSPPELNTRPAPAVSVLVSAYQAESTLHGTLASLASQTYRDFEAVIVDDGSRDGTASVVAAWCARDARVRHIPQAHRGLAEARNTALAAARAPLVTLLDADDWMLPGYLDAMVGALADQRFALAYCDAWVYHEGGRRVRRQSILAGLLAPPTAAPLLVRELVKRNIVFVACTFRRALAVELGGFRLFAEGGVEDYDLWLRMALAGARFTRVDERRAVYRQGRAGQLFSDVQRMNGATASMFDALLASDAFDDDIVPDVAMRAAACRGAATRDPRSIRASARHLLASRLFPFVRWRVFPPRALVRAHLAISLARRIGRGTRFGAIPPR
jgi:glycosyltransferase involved in cell wall biosynthesis